MRPTASRPCRCSSTASRPTLAPGPRARRAHRISPVRAGLRLGRDRRPQGGGGHPVNETARPVPVPDEQSRPFWNAAAAHVLMFARCSRLRPVRPPPRTSSVPHCGTTDPAFEFVPVDGSGTVRSWTVVRQSFLPGFERAVRPGGRRAGGAGGSAPHRPAGRRPRSAAAARRTGPAWPSRTWLPASPCPRSPWTGSP